MLVFNQALWFGSNMGQSLIATNQFLSHVIQISDNTYDQNRTLGTIDHDSDWYIPFTLQQYHVPNPTKPYNMARIESDSYAYTTCAGNNVTLLSYTGYECKVNVFQSDLK